MGEYLGGSSGREEEEARECLEGMEKAVSFRRRRWSWDWTCKRIISQLWTMLESSCIENLNVAVVILLGQLGRLGDELTLLDMKIQRLLSEQVSPSTVSALLGLVSLDLEEFHLENGDLAGMSCQSLPADVLRNWFLVLTEEQRAKSIKFIQSVG
ncbi:hypothetical protein GQ457_07G033250 [Hibiscus cannabinus]